MIPHSCAHECTRLVEGSLAPRSCVRSRHIQLSPRRAPILEWTWSKWDWRRRPCSCVPRPSPPSSAHAQSPSTPQLPPSAMESSIPSRRCGSPLYDACVQLCVWTAWQLIRWSPLVHAPASRAWSASMRARALGDWACLDARPHPHACPHGHQCTRPVHAAARRAGNISRDRLARGQLPRRLPTLLHAGAHAQPMAPACLRAAHTRTRPGTFPRSHRHQASASACHMRRSARGSSQGRSTSRCRASRPCRLTCTSTVALPKGRLSRASEIRPSAAPRTCPAPKAARGSM